MEVLVCKLPWYANQAEPVSASQMTQPPLHVCFGCSAAGTLKHALETVGRGDKVVGLVDYFSFGPIADVDVEARQKWVERELGYTDWDDITDQSAEFLARSLSHQGRITLWVSRDGASDLAGFLWWLSHAADREVSIVESSYLGILGVAEMLDLLDTAIPLSSERRSSCLAQWQQLQAENAPLRVIEAGKLISAPITYFDAQLLGHATAHWQKMAMIVALTLSDFADAQVYQTGDLVLGARLADLAEEGVLEWRGDLASMRHCELRLPQSSQAGV
jgi:hypothetical protein